MIFQDDKFRIFHQWQRMDSESLRVIPLLPLYI
jgi:hypothetical protein